jgi:hypothetical protein
VVEVTVLTADALVGSRVEWCDELVVSERVSAALVVESTGKAVVLPSVEAGDWPVGPVVLFAVVGMPAEALEVDSRVGPLEVEAGGVVASDERFEGAVVVCSNAVVVTAGPVPSAEVEVDALLPVVPAEPVAVVVTVGLVCAPALVVDSEDVVASVDPAGLVPVPVMVAVAVVPVAVPGVADVVESRD